MGTIILLMRASSVAESVCGGGVSRPLNINNRVLRRNE